MNKVKIITDSTCDLSEEVIKKYNIEVIPLLVTILGKTYRDREEISFSELMEKIEEAGELSTTTQINPQRFYDTYKKYIEEGYSIVSIHLSSKMSGTYQSATIAKDMLETDKIEIIDSNNVTSGLGLLAIEAAKLRDAGFDAKHIAEQVAPLKENIKSGLIFTSLDNLIKGGRLSKVAGAIGSLLGIKVLLNVKDGEMNVDGKFRGVKKGIKTIISNLDEQGVKEGTEVILLTAGVSEDDEIKESLKKALEERNLKYINCEVGCVVGTHSGANAAGIFFISK